MRWFVGLIDWWVALKMAVLLLIGLVAFYWILRWVADSGGFAWVFRW